MPSYKTHSIHGELIFPHINQEVEIENEDLKTFCIGPDAMIGTDYKIFNYQHENRVKQYFEVLLKLIKENKLQYNGEVMSFLYGQLDHYILDIVMHPLICYMTEDLPKINMILPHSIIEMWIDDYVSQRFNKNEKHYYKKQKINDFDLKKTINRVYKLVYNTRSAHLKYQYGIVLINMFDVMLRKNSIKMAPFIIKTFNIGDIISDENLERVLPYLNLEKNVWINPETGEKYNDSFNDLWEKSIEISLQTIQDINDYLYLNKELNNTYILNNVSYSTGIPCEKGQSFQYIKKY